MTHFSSDSPLWPYPDWPCNACNQTTCSGNSSETCGGSLSAHGFGGTRAMRILKYTCKASPPPSAITAGHHSNQLTQANYSERLLIGYRYYDAHNISFSTGFPFGHGLSYTTFEYSDLMVSTDHTVSFGVKNSGKVAGAEVAQLYL